MQRVVINGSYSSWSEVKSGVVQVSILGPILFSMFVKDIPEVLRSTKLAIFADGSKCFKVIISINDYSALQTDLSTPNSWSAENEIYFQPLKCHNLRISRRKAGPARVYTLNGTNVEVVAKEKDLGITITKDLTWNHHLTTIVSKANRKTGFIKRNCFSLLNTKTLILLYTSLVRSYFCYASQVWAPQSIIQDLKLVEKTQRRATKFICKSNTLSYKDRLLQLKLLPINYWLEYLDLVFFFKCMSGDINLNIHNYIQYCNSKSRRGSSGIYLNTPPFKTCLFRDSFFNRLANLWNAIRDNIKSQASISSFKNNLKNFFFERLK